MFKKPGFIWVCLLVIAFISSCGKFNKILKSTNLPDKYKAAEEYYQKGDYFHAQQLFEELITYYRGTANAEKIYYYYAYCSYSLNDYISAAEYFKTFATTYPNCKYTRECQYMSAYCKYLDSPDYSLDQANTLEADKELQLFVNMYPTSDTMAICNRLIDDLRFKLETKSFEISMLYFKIESYKAAIISFRNTMKDYPDTKYKEECLYYIMKSNYLYALNSVEYKKKERLQSTIDACDELISVFPQSKFLKEVESVSKNAQKELNKYTITKT